LFGVSETTFRSQGTSEKIRLNRDSKQSQPKPTQAKADKASQSKTRFRKGLNRHRH
jgi:hypothetical protein